MSDFTDVMLFAGLAAGVLALAFLLAVWRQRASSGGRAATGSSRVDAGSMPEAVRSEALPLLAAGRKIEAIKGVREGTGWDLMRSKEAVEALEYELTDDLGGQFAADRASRGSWADLDAQVGRLLAARRKIEAVKLVREHTGWTLKEAKEYVERME